MGVYCRHFDDFTKAEKDKTMAKKKVVREYDKIPVLRDEFNTYEKVKMIAQANNRGMGDQIRAWVEAELPDCGHEKVMVTVETFPTATHLLGKATHVNKAWMCTTCNRVYVIDASSVLAKPAVEVRGSANKTQKAVSS